MRRIIVLVLVLAAIGGGVALWYVKATAAAVINYRTAPVTRGKLIATIGATGTIEPEEVIDVGAQVSGRIVRFGDDLTDKSKKMGWGSVVKEGTVLAEFDDALYAAAVASEKANVAKAQADKLQKEADKELKEAMLEQAKSDFDRAEKLKKSNSIAPADYDLAKTTYKGAQANLDGAKANLALSVAQIDQAKAALRTAETNLGYTTIKSPVTGTIISRRVNTGQTVVASLQAPSLFLIARDLSKVEIWASVNEADVGQIHIGQKVSFSTDKYPGVEFQGTVMNQGGFAARLDASMTQNVVTYTVVVSTENPERTLPTGQKDYTFWPYQTANLKFLVKEADDALVVPNSALRYRPKPDQIAPEYRAAKGAGKRKPEETGKSAAAKDAPDKGAPDKAAKEAESAANEYGTVWVKEGDFVKPVRVRIGYTDGIVTEILGGHLNETMEVIIGEGRTAPQAPTDANPFGPPAFFKGKKKES